MIDISIQCKNWPNVSELIHTAAKKLFDVRPLENDELELSVVLADNDFIQKLNKSWRNKDKPTNVLSFPQEHPAILGDVILALETIRQEAEEQDISFEDHVTHLIIHGILHLLGYNHESSAEAEEMEALEIRILGELGIKNPYAPADSVS